VLWALWVIGANMQCKLFVALQLEVARHFIERCARGRTRGVEPPAAFGATETPKTSLLDPYQLPVHGRLCRCAPTLSDRMHSSCLPSRDETFSFHSRVLPDCGRKLSPGRGGRCQEVMGAVYTRQFGGSVGHPTYPGRVLFMGRSDFGARFEVKAESL
jgi:hypothetical protein